MDDTVHIKGAYVTLLDGHSVVAEAHTNARGRACLLLTPGTYRLAVAAAHLAPTERMVTIVKGKRVRVAMPMDWRLPEVAPRPRAGAAGR